MSREIVLECLILADTHDMPYHRLHDTAILAEIMKLIRYVKMHKPYRLPSPSTCLEAVQIYDLSLLIIFTKGNDGK